MPPKHKALENIYKNLDIDTESKDYVLHKGKPATKMAKKAHFAGFKGGVTSQADLLYMPNDDGYRYILVVVDIVSRKIDAEPLDSKQPKEIMYAFESIFSRNYLKEKDIKYLYTDPGTEFNNKEVHEFFEDKNIFLRHCLANRKKSMAIVESYNGVISHALQTMMSVKSLSEKDRINKWVEKLREIIKELNKEEHLKEPKIKEFIEKDPIVEKGEKILTSGTKVHVIMPYPKNEHYGEKMSGGFRAGDRRYQQKIDEVDAPIIQNGQPVRYRIKGINNGTFLRHELVTVDEYKTKITTEESDMEKVERTFEDYDPNEQKRKDNRKEKNQEKKNTKYPNMRTD